MYLVTWSKSLFERYNYLFRSEDKAKEFKKNLHISSNTPEIDIFIEEIAFED